MKVKTFLKTFKPWLLMKFSVFIAHILLTMVLFGAIGSMGFIGVFLLPFVQGVINSIFFVLTVTFIASIIYIYLHRQFIGRRRRYMGLLKAMQVVMIPSIIMYMAGVNQILVGLLIDYIVFSFIYRVV